MIYVCGDIHGKRNISKLTSKKWKEGKSLTKNDYLVILGDAGLIWDARETPAEKYWLDWLGNKPWTTLVVLGNHENYDRIFSGEFQEVELGNNKVIQVRSSIYILRRGAVYDIDDTTFFTMGGGVSTDKNERQEYISWWRQEMPSLLEYKGGLKELEKYNYKVDYILTHTCPANIFYEMYSRFDFLKYKEDGEEELRGYLDEVDSKTEFKEWHFGHFHLDFRIEKYYVHYEGEPFLLGGGR